MSDLYIAVDPGFDAMKVVANGIPFKFPFNVVETDERKMTDYRLRPDFMLLQDEQGGTYRVGQYGRELVYDNKQQVDSFYTEDRFMSKEFKIGLYAAIALAIEKNGLFEDQKNLTIHIMIALPHSSRTVYAPTIIGAIAGVHMFSLRCGEGKSKKYRFTIREDKIYTVSQTIAAILGETSDDNGNIDEDKFFYLSNGPTLVLDIGYYTAGMVVVSRGGSVDDSKTESNTSFAMANVNQLIADELREKRPGISHYAVEYLLNKDDGTIRYMENGRAEKVDLHELREKNAEIICAKLIEYLNQKYDNLLDFQYCLVTGGTGATFYHQLLAYYSEKGLMDYQHLMLASSALEGSTHDICYAIVIGAYKGLKGLCLENV